MDIERRNDYVGECVGLYILDGKTPVPAVSAIDWGRWFHAAQRRVALTRVGPYCVSTVFLGIDHQWGDGPPLLFETMVYFETVVYCIYSRRSIAS